MKLGEMLLRDGRLTDAQLQMALAAQARDGGRLGTVLVEHGLIDLDALTVYLGLELGVPIASGGMLERAKPAAVRLLAPTHAFRYKCLPLVVQDRQLIAAIEDPYDFATIEAIGSETGYRVLPRIAPELRIYYYIERYYRIPRPPRFNRFGDTPRGDDQPTDAGLPAPPLPGLPPVPAAPITAPGPRPRLRSKKQPALSPSGVPQPRGDKFDDSEALELEAEDLIDTLDADDAGAPVEPRSAPRPISAPHAIQAMPVSQPTPMPPSEVLEQLASATDRNRIVELLLAFAATAFDAAVVFTVRDNLAFGWKAMGELPDQARVEYVLIPLDAPSVVQAAAADEDGAVIHGPVTPSTVNAYFYKCLGVAEPALATSGAIRIGKRLVNVFYAHGKAEPTPLQLEDVRQVCAAAAEAYTRLIAAVKKKK